MDSVSLDKNELIWGQKVKGRGRSMTKGRAVGGVEAIAVKALSESAGLSTREYRRY